jgi:hypothetical protein
MKQCLETLSTQLPSNALPRITNGAAHAALVTKARTLLPSIRREGVARMMSGRMRATGKLPLRVSTS